MPQPAQSPCKERSDIVQSISTVVEQLQGLSQQEVEAVKGNDLGALERICEEIEKTIRFKHSLLERFQGHIQSHGCR